MRAQVPVANPDPVTGKYRDAAAGLYPGSYPSAEFFNAVSDELIAVIVGGGLTPDQNTLTQVRDAIKAIARTVQPAFALWNTTVAIPDNTPTRITAFGSSSIAVGNSTVSASGGTFTVGSQDAGLWCFVANANTHLDAGAETLRIRINNTEVAANAIQGTGFQSGLDRAVSVVRPVVAGDVIDTTWYHYNGMGQTRAMGVVTHFSGFRIRG